MQDILPKIMDDKNSKKPSYSVLDSLLLSLSKSVVVDGFVTPNLLNRVTNGNVILNAGSKAILGGVVGFLAPNRWGKIVADSLMVSASDEVVAKVFLGNGQAAAGAPRTPAGSDTFGKANQDEEVMRFI